MSCSGAAPARLTSFRRYRNERPRTSSVRSYIRQSRQVASAAALSGFTPFTSDEISVNSSGDRRPAARVPRRRSVAFSSPELPSSRCRSRPAIPPDTLSDTRHSSATVAPACECDGVSVPGRRASPIPNAQNSDRTVNGMATPGRASAPHELALPVGWMICPYRPLTVKATAPHLAQPPFRTHRSLALSGRAIQMERGSLMAESREVARNANVVELEARSLVPFNGEVDGVDAERSDGSTPGGVRQHCDPH